MKRRQLLIIGLGSIGERHLRCAFQSGWHEIVACDVNEQLLRSVTDRYDVHHAFVDLESAVAVGPTAAVICVPAHLHVAMATRLAQAGIHVLIEKPLSTSWEGVDTLSRIVAEQKVVAAVAYVHRANPILAAARQAIQSERFGRPVQLVAVAGQHFPFYRPEYRQTYYRDRAHGGGAIQDALTHLLNAGEWLLGPIDRVMADAAHQVLPDVEVEDTVHVLARHQEIPACYALNQHQAANELTITVVCQRGTVRFELHNYRWQWMTEPGNNWHDEPGAPFERDDLFIAQLLAFRNAVEGVQSPLCSLSDGMQTLRVNLSVLKSANEARWTPVSVE